ncbi:unnamed protein product [Durusdinium trenchii]|uniref:Uncharacterized protein n=1 Tax=Durusdinium trenchii TaxID=1381693 RepID=A0ABP0KKA9_9DINO
MGLVPMERSISIQSPLVFQPQIGWSCREFDPATPESPRPGARASERRSASDSVTAQGFALRAAGAPRGFSSLQLKAERRSGGAERSMNLVAIDTLHLFPTTLECAKLVEAKYGKNAMWKMPAGVTTTEEFIAKYGDCEEMDSADFDFVSKVEPFQRALTECQKDILITGRRMDQAAQRISLDVWEEQKKTLNPMANFSWQDIIEYVDKEGVPVNGGHNWAFRCDAPIEATSRHLPNLPWTKVDLGKPFWQCSEEQIKGSPAAAITYVYKSFGDMHTTVPVEPHESERAGRFVRQAKTECGIHTRTTSAGAPHGGSLVDLMIKDPADAKKMAAGAAKSIELNERQACDVFCLLSGAFSPLHGFMDETTYNSVVKDMRLPEKQLFGLPVTFDLPEVDGLKTGDNLLLKWKGEDVAVLEASSIWQPNKVVEAKECYGTSSLEHPTVASLVQEIGAVADDRASGRRRRRPVPHYGQSQY